MFEVFSRNISPNNIFLIYKYIVNKILPDLFRHLMVGRRVLFVFEVHLWGNRNEKGFEGCQLRPTNYSKRIKIY